MKKTPPPRLHILAAKEAPIVVILRRGPSKFYHCVKYNTKTDAIEYGSWFHGKLYHFRCDLSHDGQWMVYLAMGSKGETWNGICSPPWLKCAFKWSTLGAYHGGGIWKDDLVLARNMGISNDKRRKNREFKGIKDAEAISFVEHNAQGFCEDEGVLYARLKRDGWVRQGPFGTDRNIPGNTYQVAHDNDSGWKINANNGWPPINLYYRGYFNRGRTFEFVMDGYPEFFSTNDDWATFDSVGQLIIARNGCVEKWAINDLASGVPSSVLDLNNVSLPDSSYLDKKTTQSDLDSEST